jgi:hypothetical protein
MARMRDRQRPRRSVLREARLAGTVVVQAETSSGPFPLEEWRYEKRLTGSA